MVLVNAASYLLAGLAVLGVANSTQSHSLHGSIRAPVRADLLDVVFEWSYLIESEVGVMVTTYSGLGLYEFPKGTRLGYLKASKLVFGCVRGFDTVVTEFGRFPWLGAFASFEGVSYEPIRYSSARRSSPSFDQNAVADVELTVTLTDTAVLNPRDRDPVEFRPHSPIGLESRTTVRVWSRAYLLRVVMVEYTVRNLTNEPINDGAVGVAIDPNVLWIPEDVPYYYWPPPGSYPYHSFNEITGFINRAPGLIAGTTEPLDLVWYADNDGDPTGRPAVFTDRSPTSALGVRILQRPSGGCLSYNWWGFQYGAPGFYYINWGPRRRINQGGFYGSLGYPKGDRSIYKMLRKDRKSVV